MTEFTKAMNFNVKVNLETKDLVEAEKKLQKINGDLKPNKQNENENDPNKPKPSSKVQDIIKEVTTAFGKIAKIFNDIFLSSMVNITQSIQSMIKDAWNSLLKLTQFDSKGTGYSSSAWKQQMELGLTDSENAAMTQALTKLNMSMEEYWYGGYNDERYAKFEEYFELYKKEYEETQNSGFLKNIQEMKDKFELLQTQFQQTIMKFIVDNGPTIMFILEGIFQVLNFIFKGISTITSLFSNQTKSDYQVTQGVDRIIEQGLNGGRVNNINITNSMNSVSPGVTSIKQLEQAGENNYRQISNAIRT